jgi:signal transduction histidine kinase
MKQRLGIGIALLHNPSLIILDEPTNGLDPQGISDIRNLIQHLAKEEGKTILVSSHILSEIEQMAYQNAQKLLRLINQLLDLSKLESGKQQPLIAKHDLGLQLQGILQSFENFAVQKQIKLTWSLPNQSVLVYYDADIIEKCVSNLLSNAFKHTAEDGKIGLKMMYKKVDGRVKIQVFDTGKGISGEHLPYIFFLNLDMTGLSTFCQPHDTLCNQTSPLTSFPLRKIY